MVAWIWGRYPLNPERQVTLSYALLPNLAGLAAIFRHDFKGLATLPFPNFSTGVQFVSRPKNKTPRFCRGVQNRGSLVLGLAAQESRDFEIVLCFRLACRAADRV